MKSHLKPLAVILAFGLMAAVGAAQTMKVGVVDMARLFDAHYKTAEKNLVFQDEQERVKEEIQRLNDEGRLLEQEVPGLPVLQQPDRAAAARGASTASLASRPSPSMLEGFPWVAPRNGRIASATAS